MNQKNLNKILVVNKSINLTSRDIVNKLCSLFNTKKIGHTGTLDPIATGVLVIVMGKYTKLCDLLTSEYKEYIATMKLGVETDTLDITGNIVKESNYNVNNDIIKKVLESFLGKSDQEVPKYSAIKVNGKKLYEYARNNENVELPIRNIEIKSIDLLDYHDDEIAFKCLVSKGTYIRSLIRDIGLKLNTCGTMKSLIRTKQGKFDIKESYTLEDIENNNYKLLNIEDVLSFDEKNLTYEEFLSVKNGNIINKEFNKEMCLMKYKGELVSIYKTYVKDNTKAKPYIML